MYKEVTCSECDGHGFHAKFNEYSAWSERCKKCGGTGFVKEPVTNADRIRAMSDEELADFIDKCEGMGYVDSSIARDKNGHCIDMLDWLRSPAEEDT